jgi:outer membrane biosynthesis protein TonB
MGIGVTALLHAGAALAIVLSHGRQTTVTEPMNLMVARLVRLGTPRPPQLLPRKPTAAPAPAEAPPVVPETKPEEKTPAPAPEERTDLRSAMARARALAARNAPKGETDEEPEGRPEGTPEGTADTAAEGDPYATEVYRRIHEGFRVPEMVSTRELLRLKATVFLRMADVEPSGNRFFDASALEAVQRVDRLPPPPRARAAAILSSGILLEFNGADTR